MREQRRLWWLTVYDSETGLATHVVGVVGSEEPDLRDVSWMPLTDETLLWQQTDAFAGGVNLEAAEQMADGVMLGMIPLDTTPDAPDLIGAVETALDDALTAHIAEKRGRE